MKHFLYWRDRKIAFVPGEMLAYTLFRECRGGAGFGKSLGGQTQGLFCGIGACQGCLVTLEGRGSVESCLTPARDGMRVQPIQELTDGPSTTESCNDDS